MLPHTPVVLKSIYTNWWKVTIPCRSPYPRLFFNHLSTAQFLQPWWIDSLSSRICLALNLTSSWAQQKIYQLFFKEGLQSHKKSLDSKRNPENEDSQGKVDPEKDKLQTFGKILKAAIVDCTMITFLQKLYTLILLQHKKTFFWIVFGSALRHSTFLLCARQLFGCDEPVRQKNWRTQWLHSYFMECKGSHAK